MSLQMRILKEEKGEKEKEEIQTGEHSWSNCGPGVFQPIIFA